MLRTHRLPSIGEGGEGRLPTSVLHTQNIQNMTKPFKNTGLMGDVNCLAPPCEHSHDGGARQTRGWTRSERATVKYPMVISVVISSD